MQCKPFVGEGYDRHYKSAKILTCEEDGRNHDGNQSRELSCCLLIEGMERDCFKQYLIAMSRDKSPTKEKYNISEQSLRAG